MIKGLSLKKAEHVECKYVLRCDWRQSKHRLQTKNTRRQSANLLHVQNSH